MFKNKVDTYLMKAGYTEMDNVGLSMSQWVHFPLPIWVFTLEGNLVKSVLKQ